MLTDDKEDEDVDSIYRSSNGPYYDDLKLGEEIIHSDGRTITDSDNIWFTLFTCNNNPVHYNLDYAKKNFGNPPFNGRLVVNSLLVVSIVIGLSVRDTSRNGIMLEIQDCKVTNPTFAGDTLYSKSEVISKRESKSHPNMGIVTVKTTGFNQNNVQVVECQRTFMLRKRDLNWK